MPVARPVKRHKRTKNADPSASSSTVLRTSLTSLPLEILAEVLLYTCSPSTVLAVSRTCSFLYRTLALNPMASFIWRGVRSTCKPFSLPDLKDHWGKSEAEYAAFIFSGGVCEVCHKATRALYVSFALRIRLCGSWHCRIKFVKEFILNVSVEFPAQTRGSAWVPCLESQRCFRPSWGSTWPYLRESVVRKTDWEKFQLDFVAYEAAEQARAKRKNGDASTPLATEDETAEHVIERCNAAVQRFHVIMDVSAELIVWKLHYDAEFKMIKNRNQIWTRSLSEREGWNMEDLLASQTYGSLQGRKNYLLEEIETRDISPIRSMIESELLAIQARHNRQKSEAAYKNKLSEVKKIYERMRCGTSGKTSDLAYPLALPPLSVFLTLPSVRLLKGNPVPSATLPSDDSVSGNINSSPLATSLIISDIRTWLIPVEAHLMRLLGCPNGWQSASTRTASPLQRVTALFFCRRCGEGKVGRGYQRKLCLDLKGVCSHVCAATQGRSAQGVRREVPQDGDIEDTGSGDENRREEGPKKGKKKSAKTPDWVVDVFEKDEKAIRVVQTILKLTAYSEEDSSTASKLHKMDATIRCKTCTGWIVMDFDTAIGHAHRHESMEIELVPGSFPRLMCSEGRLSRTAPSSQTARFAFQRGISELLLGPSRRARNLCKKANYGCRHCFSYFYEDIKPGYVRSVKAERWKVMDFNGLRSHVKEKHGIRDIRDEDVFCFSPIEDGKGLQK